jgi:dihydrodipicolinate synthase/N-acetylneuraminate lyase
MVRQSAFSVKRFLAAGGYLVYPVKFTNMDTNWNGVFPAITTQMHEDGSLNVEGTAVHAEVLIRSGVSGIIFLGSLGENQTLTFDEKRLMMREMVASVGGRVPVLSGVAESSTADASRYVADCERLGVDGFMVMPAMCYRGDTEEAVAHLRTVAAATGRGVMVYNNPISYFNDITPETFAALADVANLVAIKESSGDTRRITDLRNAVGNRYALFTGVDNLLLESAILGIDGWVAGSGIAFPDENQCLWDLTRQGRWAEAQALYRWFTPLLHLDVSTKLVQNIKLAEQETGLGREWVRAPRRPLAGAERERVLGVIRTAVAARPELPKRVVVS